LRCDNLNSDSACAPVTKRRYRGRREASFDLELEGPLEPVSSLEMFRRHGDDRLDRWDGRLLVRTILVGQHHVAFSSEYGGALEHPRVHVIVEDTRFADQVEQCVRQTFVTPPTAFAALAQNDPVIQELAQRYPGFRPALQPNLFGALIRCISAQQVNLRWAATGRRRLAETFGHRHTVGANFVYSLDPCRLAELKVADIRALQVTNRKAEYIINLARTISAGHLTIEKLRGQSDDEVITTLIALRGIGLWTAEWVLARVLGRPRVVAGDLGVRKAVGLAYFGGRMPSESEVRAATAHWGDSAAVVQAILLHGLAEKTVAPVAISAAAALPLEPEPSREAPPATATLAARGVGLRRSRTVI
jgi:DNA-3-methyladenine glycosylase II